MRILQLHSDFIEYEPVKKEIAQAEEVEKKKYRLEELVVLFTAVEKGDDEEVAKKAIEEARADLKEIKVNKILIYPYAHLSSNLARPGDALKIVKEMEASAKGAGIETYRAPFGWTKAFNIKIKGHPLAERSKVISPETAKKKEAKPKAREDTEKIYFEIAKKIGKEKTVRWDSSSHLVAAAVKNVFPKAKLGCGFPELDGFYYDFDGGNFSESDLEKIEQEIRDVIRKRISFEKKTISKSEAKKLFVGEKYKLELMEGIGGDKITVCKVGEFVDICDEEHVPDSGKIGFVKLLKIGGAYWKGDSRNPMLQRIYGVSFPTEDELNNFLKFREEAEKRDHRKIGSQLDLFSFHEEVPGMPFFHPKGMIIINALLDFWREEHSKRGYEEVDTPIILNKKLWEQSGHWDHYKENMYFTKIDDQDFAVKPMNCPGGILIYKNSARSFREFPLKLCEIGLVHRHELSGVLSGLFRVRCFSQDDAHIFCLPEQLKDEIIKVIELTDYFYKLFGFDFHVELSTKPENAMGTEEMWERAEKVLKDALAAKKVEYKLNPGEGAFYGPKIDFHIKDCLGRNWQCGTIQVDFAMPEAFDLGYVGKDGKKHRPVMIHRTIYGSLERFLGILIEQYAGKFPVWLASVQARVLPISDKNIPYAEKIRDELDKSRIRVDADFEPNTIEYKIRNGILQKIPYLVIVGKKEQDAKKIAVRDRSGKTRYNVELQNFIEEIKGLIESKK